MENEQAINAEAELDALARNRSSSSQSPDKGRDAIQATNGGLEWQKDMAGEESPLLSKQPGQSQSASDQASDIEDREEGPPEWSGAHDFDGLPWWKRPSVSPPLAIEQHTERHRN